MSFLELDSPLPTVTTTYKLMNYSDCFLAFSLLTDLNPTIRIVCMVLIAEPSASHKETHLGSRASSARDQRNQGLPRLCDVRQRDCCLLLTWGSAAVRTTAMQSDEITVHSCHAVHSPARSLSALSPSASRQRGRRLLLPVQPSCSPTSEIAVRPLYHYKKTEIALAGPEFPWGPKSNRQGNDSFLSGATSHSKKHILLEGLSKPPRNIGVFLAVSNHLQENDLFSWVWFLTAKKNTYFLGCYSKLSSKLSFSWGLLNFLGGWQPRKCCKYLTYILVTLAKKQ